jgi:hypothetical protein
MSGHASEIRPHMEIVGSDGQHVGTVDAVEGDRIKLTRKDDPDGSGQHHHYLAIGMVATVAGNQVRLNVAARMARHRRLAAFAPAGRHDALTGAAWA